MVSLKNWTAMMLVILPIERASAVDEPQWVPIEESSDEQTQVYFDPASIARQGNLAKISVRMTFAVAELHGVREMISIEEFDCDARKIRSLYSKSYDANHKIVSAFPITDDPFADITPNTFADSQMARACQQD